MKKILLSVFTIFIIHILAFGQLTELNENFNTSCGFTMQGLPPNWSVYNPIPSTISEGSWRCGSSYGRSSTSGVRCSGLYGSPLVYHLDTSVLISPMLNLSSYTNIYLNFDTKTTDINLGAKLQIVYTKDSLQDSIDYATDITAAMMPIFSNNDVTDWVTHQVDLTPYKHITPLYIGFRYTSAAGTTGNRWFIDNILTTTTLLDLSVNPYINTATTPLSFSGSITDRHITLSCHNTFPANYTLQLLDITGRVMHTQSLELPSGTSTHTFAGLPVTTGMYIARLFNNNTQATAKILSW